MTRAIILAAGKGTRLVSGRPYPKPLQEVAGVPLIVRVIRALERSGVDEVGVVIGHLGDVLRDALEATLNAFEAPVPEGGPPPLED